MSTLDRNKPFGVVFGGYTEARYEQDGKLYDGAGNELKRSGDTTGPAIPPPAKAQSPDEKVVQATVNAVAEAEAAAKPAAKKASAKKPAAKGK